MKQQEIKTSDQIVKHQQFTLLELLDRLLDKGVVVKGEILLSVADIDLVYLNLGLLLSSVKSVEMAASRASSADAQSISWQNPTQSNFLDEPLSEAPKKSFTPTPFIEVNTQPMSSHGEIIARTLPSAIDYGLDQCFAPKTNIDPKNVEEGLTKLVLTLVDLIRKLMEKQAIRRIDAGQLNVEEMERLGNTFFLLDEKIEQLKKTFGLKDEDLNLNLGPLGDLI